MQCESCGEEIPSDSLFCPECGSRVNAGGGGISPAPSPIPTPSHQPISEMPIERIELLTQVWIDRYKELNKKPDIKSSSFPGVLIVMDS